MNVLLVEAGAKVARIEDKLLVFMRQVLITMFINLMSCVGGITKKIFVILENAIYVERKSFSYGIMEALSGLMHLVSRGPNTLVSIHPAHRVDYITIQQNMAGIARMVFMSG